ncbi:MAG: hypothetical protein AB1733_18385 [Thermodesulfobacteriota bacterium]
METLIALVDASSKEWQQIAGMLKEHGYSAMSTGKKGSLERLIQKTECRVVIVDLDYCTADNRFFRFLKTTRPQMNIFAISGRPFHPELKEALATHICACLRKPLDADELLFWLKAVLPGGAHARDPTPPHGE